MASSNPKSIRSRFQRLSRLAQGPPLGIAPSHPRKGPDGVHGQQAPTNAGTVGPSNTSFPAFCQVSARKPRRDTRVCSARTREAWSRWRLKGRMKCVRKCFYQIRSIAPARAGPKWVWSSRPLSRWPISDLVPRTDVSSSCGLN